MSDTSFDVTLDLADGYTFDVDFHQPGVPSLRMDEPPPLGDSQGPNATRVLAAAIGNCLSASMLLCLRKARIDVDGMQTVVRTTLTRNEKGRLRVEGLQVELHPALVGEGPEQAKRCLGLFEDFCVVTESVRSGIDVDVSVSLESPASAPMTSEHA